MFLINFIVWGLIVIFVDGATFPMNKRLRTLAASYESTIDKWQAVARAISQKSWNKRSTVQNRTSLAKGFNSAFLFLSDHVKINCVNCYITGSATASFTIDGSFNTSQALQDVEGQIKTIFDNITSTTITEIVNTTKTDLTAAIKGNFDDFRFPPIPVDFNLNISGIPQCHLHLEFQGLEIYVELETVISGSTFTMNLFTSDTPIGLAIQEEVELGVVLTVDLILDVDTEIDISSGFHLAIKDGAAIDINLFDKTISNFTFAGGSFEFLPVNINTNGGSLSAILRVGIHAGVEVGAPQVSIGDSLLPKLSTGIETVIYADVAQFTTNVTLNNSSNCKLQIEESYQFAVGAEVGASLAIGDQVWGPNLETSTPIFYTTLAAACLVSHNTTETSTSTSPSSTGRAFVKRQQDLTTTTITTTVIYTGVACISSGLLNCPVSLQSTSKNTTTLTLVTSVPLGSEAVFPASTQSAVTTVSFGSSIKSISATTGSPVSYVPPPSSTSQSTSTSKVIPLSTLVSKIGPKLSSEKKKVIGLSVGLGAPALLAIIAGVTALIKRRKDAYRLQYSSPWTNHRSDSHAWTTIQGSNVKKSMTVQITEQ